MRKMMIVMAMVVGLLVSGCVGMSSYQKRWVETVDSTSIKDQKTFNKDHIECSLMAYQILSSKRGTPELLLVIPYGGIPYVIALAIIGDTPIQEGDKFYFNCMTDREYSVTLPKHKEEWPANIPANSIPVGGYANEYYGNKPLN